MMRRVPAALILVVSVLFSVGGARADVTGRIYLDRNGNGKLDAGEPGVASVLVSNGITVVASDAAGKYRIAAGDGPTLLWISVPRDHTAPRGFWRWTTGAPSEDFPLASRPQSDHYYFIQITDSHVGSVELVKRFVDRVNVFPLPIEFVVNTGDLVGGVDVVMPEKATQQFDRYLDGVKNLNVPLFNLPGNHEHVSHNVKDADQKHPDYGKGLFRKRLGPTYYSWNCGPVHLVALDGTTLPYQEKLGTDQLKWLAADLESQPKGKPIVLFCHQSLPMLRDAKELTKVLQGHRVLAGFCGHLHSTFTTELSGVPVFHTGALSGSWWSGPNPDGTPQGFRLVKIDEERLETVYSNREGKYSVCVSSPMATEFVSGKVAFETVVLDFGKPVQVTAQWADHPGHLGTGPAESGVVDLEGNVRQHAARRRQRRAGNPQSPGRRDQHLPHAIPRGERAAETLSGCEGGHAEAPGACSACRRGCSRRRQAAGGDPRRYGQRIDPQFRHSDRTTQKTRPRDDSGRHVQGTQGQLQRWTDLAGVPRQTHLRLEIRLVRAASHRRRSRLQAGA